MNSEIIPGITHSLSLQVNERLLVTAFSRDFPAFADLPPVFATAFMVGFIEWACIEALQIHHHFHAEGVLVGPMFIDGGFADAGFGGDGVHAGGVDAAVGE